MANASKPDHKTQATAGKKAPAQAMLPASKAKPSMPVKSQTAKPAKAVSAKSPAPAKKISTKAPVASALNTKKKVSKPVAKKTQPPAKAKSSHGGFRPGAGRPKGSGKLGERTSSMRTTPELHESLLAIRNALIAGEPLPGAAAELELFDAKVSAGFGVPSDENSSRRVDLYTLFSPKPETTFLVKVAGWSMRGAGIHDGDYLLVDRSIDAKNGHVVVAHIEGQGLVAKRLRIDASGAFLDSENPDFKPIALGEGSQAKVWGVARAKAGLLI